ncbi:long-chain fatty acid--CoA ligase, partial [Rhizobiaceae sp. 2RAB30]
RPPHPPGRITDLIYRCGDNIYPLYFELVLLDEGRLANVAVVGVPDPQWGEQVGVVLQLKDASDAPDIGELFARCRRELAHYKAPRLWFLMEVLPRTETGQLQKFKLVEAIRAGEL